jgi:hypothetical protein
MTFSVIPPLPEIPEELRIAATSGRLIPFIGAGASRIAKAPSWEEFADGLLDQLVQREHLNHSQAQQIKDQNLAPRMKLSFVRNLAKQAGIDLDYETVIHPGRDHKNRDGRRLYGALGRLAKSFITTNYDYWLDVDLVDQQLGGDPAGTASPAAVDAERPNIIFNRSDITFDRLMDPGTVVHLHGSLRKPDEMVVTTNDYMDFYRSNPAPTGGERNSILTFLRTVFNERVVLFVGYGLGDLELLEYVILKGRTPTDPAKHFILQPFFSHELEVAQLYERYYREDCRLTMLPYLRDQHNHRQLINVIEHLAAVMPGGDLMAIERQVQMEQMLDVP